MDSINGVGKVISSAFILFFTLLFSALIIGGFNLSITAGIIISMIYMVMVIEDYMYLTVDLRILGILTFVGIFASHFKLLEYFILLAIGLLYYRIVYLALIKYVPKETKNTPDFLIDTSKALGFLPSLAAGLAIYAIYRIANYGNYPYLLQIFYDSCNEIYALIFTQLVYLVYILLPFLIIWGFLEYKYYKSEANDKIAIPMLGDGDVYVLAVWLAVLGLADMTLALFVSIVVQALAFIYKDKLQNIIGGK